MADEKLEKFVEFINSNRGKRKFKQSVELAINFKGIDFSKQENRINIEAVLPNGKGKTKSIAVFATEKPIVSKAKELGLVVIDGSEIGSIANDQARLRELLNYELLAQPNLMPAIAKALGQFLGPRGHMPKPLLGNVDLASISSEINKKVSIRSKGRFLPTVHCVIGTEDMEPQKLYENMNSVISAVAKKVEQNHIRSVFVKMSMSSSMRVM